MSAKEGPFCSAANLVKTSFEKEIANYANCCDGIVQITLKIT